MNNVQSIPYYWPELILVVTIISAIIYDLLTDPSKSQRVGMLVLVGLVLTQCANLLTVPERQLTLFLDSLALDPFSQFFKTLIILSTVFIIFISRKSNSED